MLDNQKISFGGLDSLEDLALAKPRHMQLINALFALIMESPTGTLGRGAKAMLSQCLNHSFSSVDHD
jgi:hypothetical protein